MWLDVPDVNPGDAAITANATVALAGLALLGAALPLTMSVGGSTYLAVCWPGSAAAALAQAGPGWRVMRVLADGPVPVWVVARADGAGPAPAALLLPISGAFGCEPGAARPSR